VWGKKKKQDKGGGGKKGRALGGRGKLPQEKKKHKGESLGKMI